MCVGYCVGFGRFPEGYRLLDPVDGRRIRKLLHQGSDVDPDPRVPVPRRGNEENCLESKYQRQVTCKVAKAL